MTQYLLPPGWTDDGTSLRASGFTVTRGFRTYVLSRGAFLGVPRTRAWFADDELHQIFEFGELGWNAHDGVFLCNVGDNLVRRVLPTIPPEALLPEPPPGHLADPNTVKLARVQQWLGQKTLAVYLGVWTCNFRPRDFVPLAAQARRMGIDIVYVKFGEWGIRWYGGTDQQIRQVFADQGIKVVPYWYCRPQTWQQDMAHLVDLASKFGGVDLDVEEVFLQHGTELYHLVHGIRSRVPEAVLIGDGYGDPITAFGHAFPMDALAECDCYQPQWYASFWGARDAATWLHFITWGDQQCGIEFQRVHLGWSYPIRPCTDAYLMTPDIAYAVGQAFARFRAGITIWEWQTMNAVIAAALKRGLTAAQ